MNLFFHHQAVKTHKNQLNNYILVQNELPQNTNEGSEFLDDAIRIEDLPLTYPEVNPGTIDIGF